MLARYLFDIQWVILCVNSPGLRAVVLTLGENL